MSKNKIINIIALSKEADKAKSIDSKVVNAIIGTYKDDDYNLAGFSAVNNIIRDADSATIRDYNEVLGIPEFRSGMVDYLFPKSLFPDYTDKWDVLSVATPGCTGALHLAFSSYPKVKTVLTSSYRWSNYDTMCANFKKKLVEYEVFENNKFNVDGKNGLRETLDILFDKQDSTYLLINDPANNPTGYTMTKEDWKAVASLIQEYQDKGKEVILIVDVAYMEFYDYSALDRCSTIDEYILGKLAFNEVLTKSELKHIMICFSGSKTFSIYGFRLGALVYLKPKGVDTFKKLIVDFLGIVRSTWSCTPSLGQQVFIDLFSDPNSTNFSDYKKDILNNCSALKIRRDLAVNYSIENNIPILPNNGGFFVCVKTSKAYEVCLILKEKYGVYVLPCNNILRVSFANVETPNIIRMMDSIKEVLEIVK